MKKEGLYVHIPFCEKKCFYCSFVVSIGHDNYSKRYIECLKKEASHYNKPKVHSVYIGGGTPTQLSNDDLNFLFKSLEDQFEITSDAECTIEANPENLNSEKIQSCLNWRINRFSMGVQSLNNKYLQSLGRNHTREKAIESFARLRECGAQNINVDLMFSFPDQTSEELLQDLEEITALKSEHVSLYSLTVDPNSRFYTKKLSLPEGDIQADHYRLVQKQLKLRGFDQYEVSNFSKPGFQSQHNINYWQMGDYMGLGVGAHSHCQGRRYWNVDHLMTYMSDIEAKGQSIKGEEQLTPSQQRSEALIFGLRMKKGIVWTEFIERWGELDSQRMDIIDVLKSLGLLDFQDNILRATAEGELVLDDISARLI